MKRRIAFFDFDGTVTTKDSLLEFLLFKFGKSKTYLNLLLVSPYYILHKLKLIPVQFAKERVLRRFFKNTPVEAFESSCKEYCTSVMPSLIRKKALHEFELLQEKGATIVIVSASAEDWIRPWADPLGVAVVATKLQVVNGKITGRIKGKNCRDKEKVDRINQAYDLSEWDEIYGYGDTKSDKPMLELATFVFYKPFR
ncbi:MAG TPA: HAD-IB family hydrolase [Chitinophagaceae bacterium]|nr:HAD-IB family hydrolase [Chitinophagaceae bacterium]